MTGHQDTFKIKPRLFISLLNRANDRAKLDYGGGKKTLLFLRLYGLMTWK